MTKEEAIQGHREMWNWIAEKINREERIVNIRKAKAQYASRYNGYLSANCFACEYCHRILWRNCSAGCLFNWDDSKDFRHCMAGFYSQCENAATWQEQYELAKKIANLPVRDI